jgi:hypothetical protein
VQQAQPFVSSTVSPVREAMSAASTSTSPMSLTSTTMRSSPGASASSRLTSVVLPDPSQPPRTSIGMRVSGAAGDSANRVHLAAEDGGPDGDVGPVGGVEVQRVVSQGDQVGLLSGGQRADLVVEAQLPGGVNRSSGASTSPDIDVRVAMIDAAKSGCRGPIGRSEWRATLMPCRRADPTRVIWEARSWPSQRSTKASPKNRR